MAQLALLQDPDFEQLHKQITQAHGAMRRGVDEEYDQAVWDDYGIPLAETLNFEWSIPEYRPEIDAQQNFRRNKFVVAKEVGYVTPISNPAMLQSISTKLNNAAHLAYKCGFRYVKNLARGGYGMAVLLEFKHQNGEWGPYVLKIGLQGEQRDHAVMKELARAKHIVQRVSARELNEQNGRNIQPGARPADDPQQPLDAAEPCEEPYEQDLYDFDTDESLILMEYCRHGDLGRAIVRSNLDAEKAENTGSRTSEPILWRLFKCLNKSVIGLAYPPIHQPRPGDLRAYGVPITETIPPAGERTFMNFVHFDIDPSNVFVGELDQSVHSEVPLFKLADFGTTMQVDEEFENDAEQLWKARLLGKLGHMAPEQWSPHWDLVTLNPRDDDIQVAGRYGCLTNVYQIATVMFSAIVGKGVPQPPIAKLFQVPVAGPNGDETESRYTLGWELLELENYDSLSLELRELIVDCLSLDPRHRPGPDQLSEVIDQGIRDHPMTDKDRETVKTTYLDGKDWKSKPMPWTPKENIDPNKMDEEEIIEEEEKDPKGKRKAETEKELPASKKPKHTPDP